MLVIECQRQRKTHSQDASEGTCTRAGAGLLSRFLYLRIYQHLTNMDFAARKLEVLQQLLLVDSEQMIDHLKRLLSSGSSYELTDAQKAELVVRRKKFTLGQSKNYSLHEARPLVFSAEK